MREWRSDVASKPDACRDGEVPSLSVSAGGAAIALRFCRSELARDSSDAVRLLKRGDAIASKLGSYRGGVVLGVSVGDAVRLLKRGDAIASKLGCYRGGVCQSGAQPFNTMRMMVWVAAS